MISSTQNYSYKSHKTSFGACVTAKGDLIAPVQEIGMLLDIGLQASVKGLEFDRAKNGFFSFRPAPNCKNPRISMSENREHLIIEKSKGNLSLIMSGIDDSSEQKDLFQKVVWKLFSLVPRDTIESINKAKEIEMTEEIRRRIRNTVDANKNPANEAIIHLRRKFLQGELSSEDSNDFKSEPISSAHSLYERI